MSSKRHNKAVEGLLREGDENEWPGPESFGSEETRGETEETHDDAEDIFPLNSDASDDEDDGQSEVGGDPRLEDLDDTEPGEQSSLLTPQAGYVDTITATDLLGGGVDSTNYFGQFVGGASDAMVAKTMGQTKEAAIALAGAHNESEKCNTTKEVPTLSMLIWRFLMPSTRVGLTDKAARDYRRNVNLEDFIGKRRGGSKRRASTATSSPAPLMPINAQGVRDGVAKTAVARSTAVAEDEASAGPKGKEADVVDLTEPQQVDLTGLDDGLACDLCLQAGSHSTGRCARVTSLAHGDTNTDPFCDLSTSARSRPGQQTHVLQGPQRGTFKIACPVLDAHWQNYDLCAAWHSLVFERRRMPPLAAYTLDLCFVELTLRYSAVKHGNRLPPEMDGLWPYTKADAVKYEKQCGRFWEIGMENMPPGELEGLTMDEIRQGYSDGRIKSQIRGTTSEKRRMALMPADVEHGGTHGQDKSAEKPATIDSNGDTVMGGQPSAQQVTPVAEQSGSGAVGVVESRGGAEQGRIEAPPRKLPTIKRRIPNLFQLEIERQDAEAEAAEEKKAGERYAVRGEKGMKSKLARSRLPVLLKGATEKQA